MAKPDRSSAQEEWEDPGICVVYRKLNAAIVTDVFLLLFMDGVLDAAAGLEVYNSWMVLAATIKSGCIQKIRKRRRS